MPASIGRQIFFIAAVFQLAAMISAPVLSQITTWENVSGGDWHSSLNWSHDVPNDVGSHAVFSRFPAGAGVVELSSPATVGTLRFENDTLLTIRGSGPLAFDAGESQAMLNVGGASVHIDSAITVNEVLDVRVEDNSALQLCKSEASANPMTLRMRDGGELRFCGLPDAGWDGRLELEDGTLNVDAEAHVGELIIDGGNLVGTGRLSTDSAIELIAGSIDFEPSATLVAPEIVKRGMDRAYLYGHGAENVLVDVQRGELRDQGQRGASFNVGSRFAKLADRNGGGLAGSSFIQLNSSTGMGNRGGLELASTYLLSELRLVGRSIVMVSGSTQVEQITGDSMAVHSGRLVLVADGFQDFRGTFELGVPGISTAEVVLREHGRLPSLTEIVVNRYSELLLDSEERRGFVNLSDRVSDATDLRLRGGTITVAGHESEGTTERFGDITLEAGLSTIDADGNRTVLRAARLQRTGTALFSTDAGLNAIHGSSETKMFLDDPAIDAFQMVGPWALVDVDFASYDPQFGLVQLGQVIEKVALADAVAESHVDLQFQSTNLGSDRDIASLYSLSSDIDLGGYQLNVRSGGWVHMGDSVTSNGTITSDNGELILHAFHNGNRSAWNVAANIVDSPRGPVSVTVSVNSDASIYLSGENTYSGLTTVAQGRVIATTPTAIPHEGDLSLDGGILTLDYLPEDPLHLNRLTLRQASQLFASEEHDDSVVLDATEILVESGELSVKLSGNGSLRKVTPGEGSILADNRGFTGRIDVEEGSFVVGSAFGTREAPWGLGQGTTVVHPNGILVHSSYSGDMHTNYLEADIVLRGGELATNPTTVSGWTYAGNISIEEDSIISMYDTSDGEPLPELETVRFEADVRLGDGVTTTLIGNGRFDFVQDLAVGQDATLTAEVGRVTLSGQIVATSENSRLTVNGGDDFILQSLIRVPHQTDIELVRDGESIVIELDRSSSRLQGGGKLHNDVSVRNGGTLSPGGDMNAFGTLSLGGDVQWQAGGVLRLDVGTGEEQDWDRLEIGGTLHVDASAADPFRVEVHFDSSFDAQVAQRFRFVTAADVSGATHEHMVVDPLALAGDVDFPEGARFRIETRHSYLDLVYEFLGDFNSNGLLDVGDIDSLANAIRAATQDPKFDVDDNGRVDIEDHRAWVEELKSTYFGDANLDGQFSPGDIVAVFIAGQYESDIPGSATWATGDWNGDGKFTSEDLVAAFVGGGYLKGPRQAAVPVPEMVPSIMLILLGLVTCRARQRRRTALILKSRDAFSSLFTTR